MQLIFLLLGHGPHDRYRPNLQVLPQRRIANFVGRDHDLLAGIDADVSRCHLYVNRPIIGILDDHTAALLCHSITCGISNPGYITHDTESSVYGTVRTPIVTGRCFFKNETPFAMRKHISSVSRFALRLTEGVLGVLYPSLCGECTVSVSPQHPLCAGCMAGVERADAEEVKTILQRLHEPAIAEIFAMWHFEKGSTVRRLQHQLKYGNRPSIGVWFGRALGTAWSSMDFEPPDAVVPIPLHRTRLLERGYNQSALICEGFASTLKVPVDNRSLVRIRATHSQTSLSRSRRQKNLENVFECSTSVRGLRILVIDDVLTTGATLNEAARAILRAGAVEVGAAAVGLAHT